MDPPNAQVQTLSRQDELARSTRPIQQPGKRFGLLSSIIERSEHKGIRIENRIAAFADRADHDEITVAFQKLYWSFTTPVIHASWRRKQPSVVMPGKHDLVGKFFMCVL